MWNVFAGPSKRRDLDGTATAQAHIVSGRTQVEPPALTRKLRRFIQLCRQFDARCVAGRSTIRRSSVMPQNLYHGGATLRAIARQIFRQTIIFS
ncbi:hypothetical protein [Tropicimonas marinistellae]|uniref:hypothetical protein n=1 Tax=Tropicimonas marinistellae TaxID=1739787 RepID=UPI00122E830E|nr:hypothetical protein [Tropicimonas marinistellae]